MESAGLELGRTLLLRTHRSARPEFNQLIYQLRPTVTESSANPRTLWKTLNTILHRNPSNSLPESPDALFLANTFLDFFKVKIERIRTKFSPSDYPDPFLFPPVPPPMLINFIPDTLTEIHKLISASESKQCPLDSIPTVCLQQQEPENE